MGMTEEARVNLGKMKGEALTIEQTLLLANAQASLAVVEAVEDLASQVAYLSDRLDDKAERERIGNQ